MKQFKIFLVEIIFLKKLPSNYFPLRQILRTLSFSKLILGRLFIGSKFRWFYNYFYTHKTNFLCQIYLSITYKNLFLLTKRILAVFVSCYTCWILKIILKPLSLKCLKLIKLCFKSSIYWTSSLFAKLIL